jgi:hypothetical protein
VLTQPTGQICSIANASGNVTSQVGDVTLTCTEVVLSPSVSTLALAVNDTALNTALIGTPREITITNTGTIEATEVSILYPTWPNGTMSTSTCGTTLAVGDSCAITITPDSAATSDCHTGIAPTPGTITVSAKDALESKIDVVVLSYGCFYQQGFLFSIDDTTPIAGSIGGKVAAANDQTGVFWASDGNSGPDLTTILGIDETSTKPSPSPTSPDYPPGTPAFIPCPGGCDGPCNTSNIVSYYNFNRAAGGSAPTPLNQYAAGVCRAISNGYSDWYLPAICELGYGSPACGDASLPRLQNMQSNLLDRGLLLGVGFFSLSSTQASNNPQHQVWVHFFTPNQADVLQSGAGKIATNESRFRCVRALTQ